METSNKQVQIDFFNNKPPGDNTKYIVRKHTEGLVQMVLKDL